MLYLKAKPKQDGGYCISNSPNVNKKHLQV